MGLVHALRASAEAALGDDDGPLRGRIPLNGEGGARAARRSLDLLEMLRDRTAGNLTETERDTLWAALRAVRARLGEADPGVAAAPGQGDGVAAAGPSGGSATEPSSAAGAGPSDPERAT